MIVSLTFPWLWRTMHSAPILIGKSKYCKDTAKHSSKDTTQTAVFSDRVIHLKLSWFDFDKTMSTRTR